MARNRVYWEGKLAKATQALAILEKRRSLMIHPSANKTVRRRSRRYSNLLQMWEKVQRAIRRDKRRVTMLRTTKIPYYQERIDALTPTTWDRLLADTDPWDRSTG